jgi:stress-induced morphogen
MRVLLNAISRNYLRTTISTPVSTHHFHSRRYISMADIAVQEATNAIKSVINDVQYLNVMDTTGGGGCGAKFEVVIVSPSFEGKPLLARHRAVQGAMTGKVEYHALSIKAYTPSQWQEVSK